MSTFGSAAVAKMHNGSFSCLLLLLLAQKSSFLSTFVVSLLHTSTTVLLKIIHTLQDKIFWVVPLRSFIIRYINTSDENTALHTKRYLTEFYRCSNSTNNCHKVFQVGLKGMEQFCRDWCRSTLYIV